MSEYRNRPKGIYIQQAPWDELYVLTQHWKSDLEFYRDDLRFLHHLIDKYFMWITEKENLDLVKEIKKNLFTTGKQSKDLLAKVGKHLIQLGQLVENPNSGEAAIFKMEHEHLEDEIADFVKSFRQNRKEVFAITEYIIDSEQLPHIFES
ncbi:hypothetical protein WIW50_03430 [Flavobacteriaceae bacterium 3-367]|uniref:hypothetical protein n=1 Tax=Eudoraea algarum TaxID=3417568 RepID=UPI00326CE580